MKYIKKFNEQEKSIEDWCVEFKILDYNIIDGVVDVNDDVVISKKYLEKIPIQFGKVSKKFNCGDNLLITLERSPRKVEYGFYCYNNKLISLKGGPLEVGGNYYCQFNKIKSLEGSPIKVGGEFFCQHNKLTNLLNSPRIIGGSFYCSHNKIVSIEGYPEKIGGVSIYGNNPIDRLINLFGSLKKYKLSIEEYNYQRVDKIYRKRLERACLDAGVKMPESISGYEYI